jgi:hypothetical protein
MIKFLAEAGKAPVSDVAKESAVAGVKIYALIMPCLLRCITPRSIPRGAGT